MYRLFFHDIPEAKHLFDIDQMVADGKAFDYSTIPPEMFAEELDSLVLPGSDSERAASRADRRGGRPPHLPSSAPGLGSSLFRTISYASRPRP